MDFPIATVSNLFLPGCTQALFSQALAASVRFLYPECVFARVLLIYPGACPCLFRRVLKII